MNPDTNYARMWEDFGKTKAGGLMHDKFNPRHRIGLTNMLRERWIFKTLHLQESDVVADIGCASGRQVFTAARMAKHVVGTDIASSFIEFANDLKQKDGIENVTFRNCPIEQLDIPTESVDKVICSEVIEHILDPATGMHELRRILKPGGILLITVPNYNADGTLWGRFLRLIGKRSFTPITEFTQDAIVRHGDAHVREFNVNSLRELVSSYGFTPVWSTTVSMVDFSDVILNRVLRIPPLRALIIRLEMIASAFRLPFGRHIILTCTRRPFTDSIPKSTIMHH